MSPRCPTDPDDLGSSTSDEAFGQQVLAEGGRDVAERTLVVEATRTDLLPVRSASQGGYFVSRVSGRLVVWE